MKKKILLVFLMVCLLVTLTACSSSSENPGENPEDNENKEPTIEPQIKIPVDLDVIKNDQEQVDEGHSPWQLDPLQVTMTFISLEIYPEGINGDFPVQSDELEIIAEGSQAMVEVNSDKTGIIKVYLEQLVKQDEIGIWTVIGYDADEKRQPSIAGIQLYDDKEKVKEILGTEFKETFFEEAGHYPEPFYIWKYESGFEVVFGEDSHKVYQITTTSPEGATNLESKVGDSAEEIFEVYRDKYIEPESIHGGMLYGVFKVENGQALIFDFNIEDGLVNSGEINPDAELERIILTYPEFLDDSF